VCGVRSTARLVGLRSWRFNWNLTPITQLESDPNYPNHAFGYRLRVGNYRVLFNVLETVEVVNIEEVKKRDERTY
jgi:hypothetical protein